MGKDNSNFFEDKKEWSIVKDNILSNYLKPYFMKLGSANIMFMYFDCFAGKGLYNNSKEEKLDLQSNIVPEYFGSPLIALKRYNEVCKSKRRSLYSSFCFFENMHHEALKGNISEFINKLDEYNNIRFLVDNNDYKVAISTAIKNFYYEADTSKVCTFCYIDPFGIKDLHISLLETIAKQNSFSLEFLINFNSHGFFRAACAILKIKIKADDLKDGDDLIEDDPLDIDNLNQKKGIQLLNSIMGCQDWIQIIDEYKDEIIDGYEARDKIVDLYKAQISKKLNLQYVINIPIKFKEKGPCKYHMIFATNHEDGAFIMGSTMKKQEQYMSYKISCGQGDLFAELDKEQESSIAKERIIEIVRDNQSINVTKLIAMYYNNHGIPNCDFNKIIRELEKNNSIIIKREPAFTSQGKKSNFIYEDKCKNKRAWVELKK